MPEDRFERAKVLQWMFFEQYSHEPNIAVVRFWLAYSGEARPAAEQLAPRARPATARSTRWSAGWRTRDFLVGERATRSPTSRSTPTRTSPTRAASTSRGYPAIGAWLERVAAQPGHVPIDA